MECLKGFYENYDEEGRLGNRHGTVEYATTMHYILRYLAPGMKVLEIGAATGRYSHAIARMGYEVDAVELLEHHVRQFRENTQPGEKVTIRQGNALDLKDFEDQTYDVTLLLGPMYHLFTPQDQRQAIAEAIRVTKKGGIVFAAYCNNDATIVQYVFQKGKYHDPKYQALIDPVTFKASSSPDEVFVLYRKEEIDALMEGFPVTRLHYLGTDMAANFIRQSVDEMDDWLFDRFLAYTLTICERPDMVGATHHVLDVFRVEG